MKILITGANGMLGSEVCANLVARGCEVFATDIKGLPLHLDIADAGQVNSMVGYLKPDMIMHFAAETDVDKCEIEKEHAYKLNAEATENIASVCRKRDIVLCYSSTAYVFGGEKELPYVETDKPNPHNVYGKSKLKGEEAVKGLLKKYFIIRAGWMIGGIDRDKKFVAKILKQLETENELDVVSDRFGSPTFTKDFSHCLLKLIETTKYGVYHMANKGGCSRFDMAKKVVEFMGRKDVRVNAINSSEFPLPAERGRYEILENKALEKLGMNNMRPWEVALKEYILEWKRRKAI